MGVQPRSAGPHPLRALQVLAVSAGLLAGLACGDPQSPSGEPNPVPDGDRPAERPAPHFGELSADAHPEILESLLEDIGAPRHPSDGGGRARIEAAWRIGPEGATPAPRDENGEAQLGAATPGRFRIAFEVGPEGISEGGFVFLQVSPFWEWDDPQPLYDDAPGFTQVTTSAEGVTLEPLLVGSGLLSIEVGGRALAPGERLEIVYGAGPLGARVDRYAERGSRLWIAVDGDGDGVRRILPDSPSVRVLPREPARLVATLPSTAEPGDAVRLTLAVLDGLGNAGIPFAGEIEIEADDGLEAPARVRLAPDQLGRTHVEVRAARAGSLRVRARTETPYGALEAESNPLVVREGIEEIFWGDLHGHSHLSDGTGSPDDFYDYARDVAGLDVAALTDHDHWGMQFLDAHPDMWEEIRAAAARHHEPGRFVTLVGYEWTSWLQGHRHVLYFSEDGAGEVLSSVDPRFQTPPQLWEALRGKNALTFAHHSAGGPISTNWSWAPPPDLEPVTEIASVHGSSEADDLPGMIYSPVRGNFVRDVLRVGYRFGFIGSGDSHDGHPGLAGIATGGTSGLAAIRAREKTRAGVLEALQARRTYATTGPRIFLETSLASPGSEADGLATLSVEVAAVAPIERVDFVRTGLVASVPGEGRRELRIEREVPPLAAGEFLYVRVVQVDRGVAWSSPFYGPEPEPAR